LAVGPGRDDAVSAALLQGDGGEEASGELMASDRAGVITAAVVNLICGSVVEAR
jgi:hypothetical protein